MAPPGMKFTQEVSLVYDLYGGVVFVENYVPVMASVSSDIVTETITVYTPSFGVYKGFVAAMEAIFYKARLRAADGKSDRMFFEISADGLGYRRSPIIDGAIVSNNETMTLGLAGGGTSVEVTITRANYWEYSTEQQMSLSANGVSGFTTSAVTLYNSYAAGSSIYSVVHCNTILGDMPAPIRVEYKNTYTSASRTKDVFVGHIVEDSGQFVPIWEGEGGTIVSGSTVSSASNYSQSSYANLSWSGSAITQLWTKSLPSSFITTCKSDYFRILAISRGGGTPSGNLQLKARLTQYGLSEIWSGNWQAADKMVDFGSAQMISNLRGLGSYAPIQLEIFGRQLTSTGACSFDLDFVYFMPANQFRVYRSLGYDLDLNETIHDKPQEGLIYNLEAGGTALANYRAEGDPIYVTPGTSVMNAFHFLTNQTSDATRTCQVRIWYRPRSRQAFIA